MTSENNFDQAKQLPSLSLLGDHVSPATVVETAQSLLAGGELTFNVRAQLEVVGDRTVLDSLELVFVPFRESDSALPDGRILYTGVVEEAGAEIRLIVTSRPGDFYHCWCLEGRVRAQLGEVINFGDHALIRQRQPQLQ